MGNRISRDNGVTVERRRETRAPGGDETDMIKISTIKEFFWGLYYGYPICCIIAYCRGKAKGIVIRNNDIKNVYRPCEKHRKTIGISDKEFLTKINDGVCPLPDTDFDSNGDFDL